MLRVLLVGLLIFLLSSPVSAQSNNKKRVIDKKFTAVNSLFGASIVLDVESTFLTLKNCPSCREANPVMRPFVESGRLATYSIQASVGTLVVLTSYKMKKADSKIWWLFPVIGIVAHCAAGGSNLSLNF